MLAVVKKPHTEQKLFEIKGQIPSNVLRYLEKTFGRNIEVFDDENDVVNLFETDWYRDMRRQISAGDILRIYRENLGMTQAELAEKLGQLTEQAIFDMENNRQSISKELAGHFGVPMERFLYGL